MITYILKFIIASSLLYIIYYSFLEKEKIYRFNRFYLLSSILFSIIIPFISISIKSAPIPISEPIILLDNGFQNFNIQSTTQSATDINILKIVIWGVYLSISLFLLYRYFRNIFAVLFNIKNNKTVAYLNARLVLTNERHYPFSFLKYIFVNSDEFEKGKIEDEILSHELTHVNQKHSFDILFIELLLIFTWINPILFLYRRAIQLNHEFLADESVIRGSGKTLEYQYLLVAKSDHTCKPALSSTFNFLPIKKRIIMMNKNYSPRIAIIKKIVVVPIIVVIGFLFTFKIVAQNIESEIEKNQFASEKEGVSQKLLDEYQTIIDGHKKLIRNGKYSTCLTDFTKAELEKMEVIFDQMSKEQKLKQELGFIPSNTMYLKEVALSNEQLELYKDSKMYGVWINEKRVNNEILNKYKNTDFSHANVSKLEKNAKNYGKHYYQVNLMTNDYYRDYKNEVTSREGRTLVPIGMYKKIMQD